MLFGNLCCYRKEKSDPATIARSTPDWKDDILDKAPGMHYTGLGGLALFTLTFGWVWGPVAWFSHAVASIMLIVLRPMISALRAQGVSRE